MSVEVYKKEGKTVGCFKRNKEKYFELKLDDVGKVFYPCLAMRSRGAAAKLLSDRFWISDKSSSETHKVSFCVFIFISVSHICNVDTSGS